MTDPHDSQPTEALTRRSARSADGAPTRGSASEQPAIEVGSGGAKPATGVAALIARHPTAWLASALGVAFLLLGTGAIFAGVSVGSGASAVVPLSSNSEVPPRPTPSALPVSTHLRTCSIAALAADPTLMAFSGQVVKVSTGEVLFDRSGTVGARTGSVLKLLTASAAVAVLGANGQLSTRVIDGSTPGSIVLVGGGDPTLTAYGNSFYDGAPTMADLASQVQAKYSQLHPGVPITEIILDSTMWSPSDNWDSSWLRKEQADGYQAPVTALMVDGDRENPARSVSTRLDDPIAVAGQAFADNLGVSGSVTFGSGSAVAGKDLLGEVKSQPVSTLIDQMLQSSDNVLAEMLARVVSKTMGFDGSSGSLAQAIPGALKTFNVDSSGLVIRDGSGLSDINSVPPAFVNQLLLKIAAGGQDLNVVLSGMPVAGVSGSLASRFTGANSVAQGAVIAKTGWLDAEYSLAGIVNAADGNQFVFAFYAIGDGISEDAKESLDTLTTGVFNCGDNLSNN